MLRKLHQIKLRLFWLGTQNIGNNKYNERKLIKIGFIEPKSNLFVTEISGYQISIIYNLGKPENSKIDYGSKIKVWQKTTSNLTKDENLVVLECVVRLLQKGYRPESIELEKTWKSGHGTSVLPSVF